MDKKYLIDRDELSKVPFNYGSMCWEGECRPEQPVTVTAEASKPAVVPVMRIQNPMTIKRPYPKSISRF